MRLYMSNQHPDAVGRWAIVNADTGQVVSDYGTESEALAHLQGASSMFADGGGDDDAPEAGQAWSGPIGFEDIETSDRRYIQPNALKFRAFPLPLMWQGETAWGHDGAIIAGRIDGASREDGGAIVAYGVFDTADDGVNAARLVGDETLNGVSMDLSVSDVEFEVTEVDEDGFPVAGREVVVAGELMGATITPFPAFADARIRLDGVAASGAPAVVAAGGPADPPVEWFDDPNLEGPTPLVVTEDGRVYGHLAAWGECHIGRPDMCLTAPNSLSRYAYFTTGEVSCADGCAIPVGQITMDTGHADLALNHRTAAAHYDDTGTVVADVACGEDSYGVWVAGSMRPGLSDEQIRKFRASSPSGDWRRIGGGLELVAILAVNVPGFPVPRARVASGTEVSLVAAASPHRPLPEQIDSLAASGVSVDPLVLAALKQVSREVAALQSAVRPLLAVAAERIDAGMRL